ncbi:MAG: HipA domain-containing protein [bacterium]|nr:HipA domain-containing protein [bacterium]
MAESTELTVLLNGLVAGSVRILDAGRAEFAYDSDYLARRESIPLSMSLPFSDQPFNAETTMRWINGLLPDNERVLERWYQNEGVSPPTTLGLMATRVGHDCAGAVQFCRSGQESELTARESGLRTLGQAQLEEEVALMALDTARWLPDDEDAYFSLGGFQAKTALHRQGSGWARPYGATPTTHILKPSPSGRPDQAVVEHLCLASARRLGMPAADSEIAAFAGHPTVIVTRYDRERTGGNWIRVHQEDMCQALGRSPQQKYEKYGGPGILAIGDAISLFSIEPEIDLGRFRDALLYYWMIVNRDGHARNFSIIVHTRGVRLAPLYDVGSALPFAKKRIGEMELAMRFGSDFTVYRSGAKDSLRSLAAYLALPLDSTLDRAEEIAASAVSALDSEIAAMPPGIPTSRSLDTFRSRLKKRSDDCLRTVAANRRAARKKPVSEDRELAPRDLSPLDVTVGVKQLCRHIGKRTRKPCVLPLGHQGQHRYG